MRGANTILAAVLTVSSVPSVASADEPAAPSRPAGPEPQWSRSHPIAAMTLSLGGGLGGFFLTEGLGRARAAHHYERPSNVAGGFIAVLGLEVMRFVIEGEAQMNGDFGDESSLRQTTSVLSLGYRLTSSGPWLITPLIGIGEAQTSSCVGGNPSQQPMPDASSFDQVLATPGPSRCLDHSRIIGRVGLAIDYRALLSEQFGPAVGFLLGLRLQATAPLSTGNWSLPEYETPEFAGPQAPVLAFSAMLVAGLTFGLPGELLHK